MSISFSTSNPILTDLGQQQYNGYYQTITPTFLIDVSSVTPSINQNTVSLSATYPSTNTNTPESGNSVTSTYNINYYYDGLIQLPSSFLLSAILSSSNLTTAFLCGLPICYGQSIKLQATCTNVGNIGTFFYNATNLINYTLSTDAHNKNITISTGETDLTNVIPVNITNVTPTATNSVSLALSTTMIVSSSTIYISGQSILPGTTISSSTIISNPTLSSLTSSSVYLYNTASQLTTATIQMTPSTSLILSTPNSSIKSGMIISGNNIVPGTTVTTIDPTYSLTLSNSTLSNITNANVSFYNVTTNNLNNTYTIIGNITGGSPIFTPLNTTNLSVSVSVGMFVNELNGNIPSGTFVNSVSNNNIITLSKNAINTTAQISLYFYNPIISATASTNTFTNNNNIPLNALLYNGNGNGNGITNGTRVISVVGNNISLDTFVTNSNAITVSYYTTSQTLTATTTNTNTTSLILPGIVSSIYKNMAVSGSGIRSGTIVSSIDGTSIVLSKPTNSLLTSSQIITFSSFSDDKSQIVAPMTFINSNVTLTFGNQQTDFISNYLNPSYFGSLSLQAMVYNVQNIPTICNPTPLYIIYDASSYLVASTPIPKSNLSTSVVGYRISSGIYTGQEMSTSTQLINLLTNYSSSQIAYLCSTQFNHSQPLTLNNELLYSNSLYQTPGINLMGGLAINLGYANYSNYVSPSNNALNYTTISTTNYRYMTFAWNINTTTSISLQKINITLNYCSLSNPSAGSSLSPIFSTYTSYTILTNNQINISNSTGTPVSPIQLYCRLEDTGLPLPSNGSGVTLSPTNTPWINGNTILPLPSNYTQYNTPQNISTQITQSTSYSGNIGNNTINTYTKYTDANFVIGLGTPVTITNNNVYLLCRVGLPMNIPFACQSVSARLS